MNAKKRNLELNVRADYAFGDRTQKELAKKYGISQARVSQLVGKSTFKPFKVKLPKVNVKPFLGGQNIKIGGVPYFYRGKLVGFSDKAVNETLQEEAFNEYMWKSRAISIAIAWGIMTLAFVILILGRVL